MLRFCGRVWLGNNVKLQQQVMRALHNSSVGGHSGFPATYRRIKHLFAWPGMKEHIKMHVQTCQVCQQAKPDRSPYPGLLQPLPVAKRCWDIVSLDFIEGLPTSGRYKCILVVVDTFSKYAHFLPVAHPYIAQQIAQMYIDNVYKLHGMPEALVSDKDAIFTSKVWQEIFKLQGVELKMSSSHHPQTDGQTERVNQCVETYLRCFVHSSPKNWSKWLALAEFWYNSAFHSTLGKTPFMVVYGQEPRQLGITPEHATPLPELNEWLEERQQMQDVLRQHLMRAKQIMKHHADKKRSVREFQVGDKVFLKLQPYIQTSVARRANHKLSFKFFGPFPVIRRINEVTYELQLPAESAIFPVFHVSQVRKMLTPGTSASSHLPPVSDIANVPFKVLEKRWRRGIRKNREQGLVRWQDEQATTDTWEDLADLQRRFPAASTWGQVDSEGGGGVSNLPDGGTPQPEEGHNQTSRPRRERRPNHKFTGPQWISYMFGPSEE